MTDTQSQQPPRDEIIANISTKSDLLDVQNKTNELLKQLYHTQQQDLASWIDRDYPYEIAKNIKEEIRASAVDTKNRESVRKYIEGLNKRLQSTKIYSITVAFHPHADTVKLFSDHIKKQFGDYTVVDIAVNPEIMAGVIISFDGRYLDSSLGKKVSDAVDARKDQIVNTFKV